MRAHAYIVEKQTESSGAPIEYMTMDSFDALFDMIGVLARRRYQTAERSFALLGLNHTEARLLSLLHQENGQATQDALSNMLFIDRSNAGRALQRLERDGYIVRRKDDADKRTNLVQIKDKGGEAVREIKKIRKRMAQEFFGDLKKQEASAIVAMFEKAIPEGERQLY